MHSSFIRRVLGVGAFALSATLLAGCSIFSPSNPRYDPVPLTDYQAGVSASVLWSVSVGGRSGSGFAPQVVGESVYAAAPNGSVVKVALASGAVQWRTEAGQPLSAGVGSDGRITAVAARDGTVIAFDDQGREKWQAKASSQVDIPPAVGAGVVVVRSSDYRIQAFDAETGEALWNVQRPGPALALKTNMRMIIIEDMLLSGLPNGRLIAIDSASGAVQWEGTVTVSRGATDLERISDIVGAPQVQGPLLCGAAYQGHIVCFNITEGGRPIWEQPFSSITGITVDPHQVYGVSQRDVVHAFALNDGHEAWKQEGLRNRRLAGPAVVPQALAVGDYEGYLHFLSRNNGNLIGRVQVGGGAIVSPLVGSDYGVLVQTGNGNLMLVGVN